MTDADASSGIALGRICRGSQTLHWLPRSDLLADYPSQPARVSSFIATRSLAGVKHHGTTVELGGLQLDVEAGVLGFRGTTAKTPFRTFSSAYRRLQTLLHKLVSTLINSSKLSSINRFSISSSSLHSSREHSILPALGSRENAGDMQPAVLLSLAFLLWTSFASWLATSFSSLSSVSLTPCNPSKVISRPGSRLSLTRFRGVMANFWRTLVGLGKPAHKTVQYAL